MLRRLVLFSLLPLLAGGAERLLTARLEGPEVADTHAVRAILEVLPGQPATDRRLVLAIRELERVEGMGGLQVERSVEGEDVHVVFVHDGRLSRIAELGFVIDGVELAPTEAVRFQRRLAATTDGLRLTPGLRYHPFLRGVDRRTLLRWAAGRGYRDAQVALDADADDGLHRLVWRIDRGPAHRAASVTVVGARGAAGASKLQPGDVLSPRSVEADVRRIRERLCRAGFPRAKVEVEEADAAPASDRRRPVDLRFVVEPGPRIRVAAVRTAGRMLPVELVEGLPLQEGGPYCPSLVEESLERLREHLRNTGVPDPRVVVHEQTWLDPKGRRRQAVTFDVRWLSDADVERIWFEGNKVTRLDVLEQMLAIAPGDRYAQAAVDASVQAMRRSGLFKRVDVEVIQGTRSDRVYLTFRVVERDALGFDVVDQQLIVYNVDLAHWPEDLADFETGQPFRGAGQRMDLFGSSSYQALLWRDDFLTRHLVTRAGGSRSVSSNAGFDEQWYDLNGGFGVKALEGAFQTVLFGELEWTFTDQKTETTLPVLDGDALTVALGLDLRVDLSRRDDERVQYLGVELDVTGRGGRSVEGAEFSWAGLTTRLRGHLPLWTTDRGQHLVLRVSGRNRSLFADSAGRLQAHQRVFPAARGYSGKAIGVDFLLDDGDTLSLGGLHALDGVAELRIPLPYGRRNAISPFAEAAMVSDDRARLLDDIYPTAGLAYAFSFFDERLEGVLWGAWGLRDGPSREYVGGALGGNF